MDDSASKSSNVHELDEENRSSRGLDVFHERIEHFTADDYCTSVPYAQLLFDANGKEVFYDQFGAVLKADAVSKGMDAAAMDKAIEACKREYLLPEKYGIPIVDLIDLIKNDQENKDRISVVPLMCGAGKSTAISYLIRDTLKAINDTPNNTDGLLIVTDLKKRMDDYLTPGEDRLPELHAYLQANKDKVAIIKHGDDWKESQAKRYDRPILIITTQRYFQTPKERIEQFFLKWKHGCRPLVIFDEHIPLKEVVQIDRRAINQVASALCDDIEYAISEDDPEELLDENHDNDGPLDPKMILWRNKKWCVEQWELVREKIYNKIEEFERIYDTDDYHLYYEWPDGAMTENDERFLGYIDLKRRFLQMADGDVLKTIKAVHSMMTEGSLYHCVKKKNHYENVFSVAVDNSSLVTNLSIGDDRKAKVIVLDGTGDIHPDTAASSCPEYIDLRLENGTKYDRWLSMLNIHMVNEATGRTSLTGSDGDKNKRRIKAYLSNLASVDPTLPQNKKPLVFTYMSVEGTFSNFRTAHFNAIKGLNEYRDDRLIAQVGLNRLPDWYVLTYYLGNHPEWREELREMELGDTSAEIEDKRTTSTEVSDLMARFVLADIEQNMFRGSIRQAKSIESMHYYILTRRNDPLYARLYELMKERYQDRLCAKLFEEEMPDGFAKPDSNFQYNQIIEYCKNHDGDFTTADIRNTLKLTAYQLNNAKKDPRVKRVMVRREGTQRYYCPKEEDGSHNSI